MSYKTLALFVLLGLVATVSATTSLEMMSALTAEAAKIAANSPANAGSFVNNIQSHGAFNADSFEISQTMKILQTKLQLPQQAVDRFKNIIFADSLNFETFSVSITVNQGMITEFLGTARKVGTQADIAYIEVSSSGNLIAQYQSVSTRSCHRVGFWKKCHTNTQQVPRGFSAQEIGVITDTLRASAYQYVLAQLKNPPAQLKSFETLRPQMLQDNKKAYPPVFLTLQNTASSDEDATGKKLVIELVQSILAKVPEMKKDIERDTTVVVDKIVNRGFTTFNEQASIEEYSGVQEQYVDLFLDNLDSELYLPAEYSSQFRTIMKDILYADSNDWLGFNVAFSVGKGADCKYVCVLARHNQDTKKIDWLVANIKATFELAPNLLIVQEKKSVLGGLWSKSQEKVVLMPASITLDQLRTVFEFFEIVAFTRFAEMLNINIPKTAVALTVKQPVIKRAAVNQIAVMAALALAKSGIEAVTSVWTGIVNAFKTTKTSELKQILQGKGFSYFSQSAQVQKIIGLREDYYSKFKEELIVRLKVPEDKKLDFQNVLDDFEFMDEQTWSAYHMVFSQGTGGDCKFVTILAHHNATENKIDFLLSDMQANFKLAPDVLVIQESRSIAGGIYSDSKIKFQEMPRSVTQEDMKAVFDFFYIVAFKNFADLLGVKVDLPPLN